MYFQKVTVMILQERKKHYICSCETAVSEMTVSQLRPIFLSKEERSHSYMTDVRGKWGEKIGKDGAVFFKNPKLYWHEIF